MAVTPVRTRAFADLQLAFAGDQSNLANLDSGDVSDGIERSGCTVKGDTEIAGPRLGP